MDLFKKKQTQEDGIKIDAIEKEPKFNSVKIKRFIANLVIPLIALVIMGVLFFAFIRPSFSDKPLLEQELTQKTELAEKLRVKSSKLENLLDFKTSVEENNVLLENVLVSDPEVPQLLTQIDQIANEAGLEISKVSYSIRDLGGTNEEQLPYDIVAVNLGTKGSYAQTVAFLKSIENSGRVVFVSDLKFNLVENEEIGSYISTSYVLISPYVQVDTEAATDDPIEFELTNAKFQAVMDEVKQLRIYDISIDEVINIEEIEEVEVIEGEAPLEAAEPVAPETPAEDGASEIPLTEEEIEEIINEEASLTFP